MALQTSGQITHTDIATEFGYTTSDFSLNADGVPILNSLGESRVVGSSQVAESDFYGLSASNAIAGQYWRLWQQTLGRSDYGFVPGYLQAEVFQSNNSTARPPAQWHDDGPDPFMPYYSPNDVGGGREDAGGFSDIIDGTQGATTPIDNERWRVTVNTREAFTPANRIDLGPDPEGIIGQSDHTDTYHEGAFFGLTNWDRSSSGYAAGSAPTGTLRWMIPIQKLERRLYFLYWRELSPLPRDANTAYRVRASFVCFSDWTGAIGSNTSSATNMANETSSTSMINTGWQTSNYSADRSASFTPDGEFVFLDLILETTAVRIPTGSGIQGVQNLQIIPA